MKINLLDYINDKPRFKTKWGLLREKDLFIIGYIFAQGQSPSDYKEEILTNLKKLT